MRTHHPLPAFLLPLSHGIYAIDTGFERPGFDAAYLIVQEGRAAFIDTGHNAAVPRLLAALEHVGLSVDAVDWVIPTHVHLDHAGGVGLLMQHLPHAQVLIHPRGVRHLIDPSALIAGAEGVYGAEVVQKTYGTVVPVSAERVLASHDGMEVVLGGSRPLLLIDTPGHARHHHCVWDARSHGWFSGDTLGISYREFDGPQGPHSAWIFPSATPVQFDPPALKASIERMMGFGPHWFYLTHFGRVGGHLDHTSRLAMQLLDLTDAYATLASTQAENDLLQGMRHTLITSARSHGATLNEATAAALLRHDIALNAQGLAIWQRQKANESSPQKASPSSFRARASN
ncbi:MBL fold metallo-hydrolase [Leptothrix ochracea]|uniref:MBL fold metallo-hydrolase n=1 Tax=Leptothrix ochracea TaxID=735331 RepID=UPI0034E24CC8